MNHKDKVKAILFIRPNAEFVLRDLDIEWMDTNQTQPTEEEIAQGWIDYQAKEAADKAAADAKKQALLDKLGITEEEAKLLLS
jgi:membrane protein involved in colicin uptake